jgi:TatD DNase family protein
LFLDSHCHLDKLDPKHHPQGVEGALCFARENQVNRFLCIGIGLDNLEKVVAYAETWPDVFAAVGIHPSEYNDDPDLPDLLPEVIRRLQDYAGHPRVVAIGETGLDFTRLDHASTEGSRESQIESFHAHLALAREVGLPVVVHTRGAEVETLAAIRACQSNAAGVLHCFTESWDMASAAIDDGYCISISGIVTFKSAENVREVARRVPLDRLLVETDSPWLSPVPYRGKSNQPAYVAEVYRFLAELRNEPLEDMAAAVSANFSRLFPKSV